MPESSRLASVGRMEEADEIFKSFAEGSNYQQGQNWPGNGSMRHNKATNKGFLPIWIDLLHIENDYHVMIYAYVYTLGCFCSYSNMDMIKDYGGCYG